MLKYLWLSLMVTVLDQVSKYFVFSSMALGQRINVLPVFDITYRHNPGMAFSFLANAGGWKWAFLVTVTLVLSVILLVWIARMKPWEKLQAIGMAIILGGAVGNLLDRFLHTDAIGNKEGVVDFLLFYWGNREFPAFNIADSAITIGVVIILWFMLFVREPNEAQESTSGTVNE